MDTIITALVISALAASPIIIALLVVDGIISFPKKEDDRDRIHDAVRDGVAKYDMDDDDKDLGDIADEIVEIKYGGGVGIMDVEEARKIREEALEDYKELARLDYLPEVESAIKGAAEKGHSNTSIKLGGGYKEREPVPDKKVVDEVIRTLRSRGFGAEDEFVDVVDLGGILEHHASRHGRTIKIKW